MPITYNLAPIPRWLFTDLAGNILSNGSMNTYRDVNHAQYKTVYQDPAGTIPWPQPISFDLNGMAGPFYWASDEDYFLAVFDMNGTPQFTVPQYNAPGQGGTVVTAPFLENLVRNPQFSYFTNTTSFPNYGTADEDADDFTADDWTFTRSNLNSTINLSQGTFLLGQIDVPGTPRNYYHYECTSAGAGGETRKYLYQSYNSVQTLSGVTVTVSIWAKTETTGTIACDFSQDFGTGGSPSNIVITNVIPPTTLTTSWTQYSGTVTLPSVAGQVLGTNGDDILALRFDLPLNQPATVDLVNVLMQPGSAINTFPYLTINDQYRHTDNLVSFATFYTGDVKATIATVVPFGWLMMNDNTIGNPSSNAFYNFFYTKALFELLWSAVPNIYCPIYNSDGTYGTRGTNAEADYNANKQLLLPRTLGRALAGAGLPTMEQMFTADGSTAVLTVPDTSSFYTTTPVTLTTTGTLPAPFATATTYYAVPLSTTTVSLATSIFNAEIGSVITTTTVGTGQQTMTIDYNDTPGTVNGQPLGQGAHRQLISEMPTHSHASGAGTGSSVAGGSALGGSTGNTGGGNAFNIIQPTIYLNYMIKL